MGYRYAAADRGSVEGTGNGGRSLSEGSGTGAVAGEPGVTAGNAMSKFRRISPGFDGSPVAGWRGDDRPGDDRPGDAVESPNVPDRTGSGRLSVEPADPDGISIVTLVDRRGGRLIPVPDDPFAPGTVGRGVPGGIVGRSNGPRYGVDGNSIAEPGCGSGAMSSPLFGCGTGYGFGSGARSSGFDLIARGNGFTNSGSNGSVGVPVLPTPGLACWGAIRIGVRELSPEPGRA
jgi:hypothetical protein